MNEGHGQCCTRGATHPGRPVTITSEKLTKAAGEDNSDAAVAAELIGGEAGKAEVYGDSAYGTGDLRAGLEQAGHTAVIKPKPLKPAVEGGFTLDDFTVDEAARTVTCPAGITRPITAARSVTWPDHPAPHSTRPLAATPATCQAGIQREERPRGRPTGPGLTTAQTVIVGALPAPTALVQRPPGWLVFFARGGPPASLIIPGELR